MTLQGSSDLKIMTANVIVSGVQVCLSGSSTSSFEPADALTCCMQELECSAPPSEGS